MNEIVSGTVKDMLCELEEDLIDLKNSEIEINTKINLLKEIQKRAKETEKWLNEKSLED